VRNFNEPAPVLSLPLNFDDKGFASFALDESQMAQLRGAALCQLKGISAKGHDELSNQVALAQLHQLLKERGSHSGPRNALQTIAETGENLVPHVTVWEACAKRWSSSTIAASASSTVRP
jgi:hypothetical protein